MCLCFLLSSFLQVVVCECVFAIVSVSVSVCISLNVNVLVSEVGVCICVSMLEHNCCVGVCMVAYRGFVLLCERVCG